MTHFGRHTEPHRIQRFLNAAFLFLLLLALASAGWAGQPTDQVKETTDQILALLRDPAMKSAERSNEKKERISRIADLRFDWEEIARRTLGRHWAQRAPDEQREFVALFRRLIERSYLDRVDLYSGETVKYQGDRIDGNFAVVNAVLVTSTKTEVAFQYRVRKKGDQWLIYDITIEAVSLVANYRTQINSILVKSPYPELVRMIKARVAQE
jgi:phospholipid transport system substrate-binding protein